MADTKTKYRAGFADSVFCFNTQQMKEQSSGRSELKSSWFQNEYTPNDPRARSISKTDILFSFRLPHIGSSGMYSTNIPCKPKLHSALTGLQTLPGQMEGGIIEFMDQNGISEEMMILSVLACIQVHGAAYQDYALQDAAGKQAAEMTVQISGVVTAHAYEKMWTGAHVRVTIPTKAMFSGGDWEQGEGRSLGAITLVPTAGTPRDVTSFAATLMQAYIYNRGQRALGLMRKSANYNMFANFGSIMKETLLTAGILFNYAMNEVGMASVPAIPANLNGVAVPAQRVRPVGADLGVALEDEGLETFGPSMAGNFGRIFYNRANPADRGAAGDGQNAAGLRRGVSNMPVINRPAEVAVFHGLMSGLLANRNSLGPAPAVAPGTPPFERVVQHVQHVATSAAFIEDRKAYDRAIDRFFMMAFPNSSAGGSVDISEFGQEQFGALEHRARDVPNDPNEYAGPSNNYYGRMLVQQKQMFAACIASAENMWNFNDGLRLGRVTSGSERGGRFQYFYNL